MMKLLISLLFLLTSTFAVTLNKAENFAEAQAQAQAENKRIMVLITQDNCRYCKRMKKTTFKDPEIIKRIHKDYIFVEVDRYFDEYPEDLTVYGVPTTYFLYNDAKHIMRGAGGYWGSEDFHSFMDDADKKVKKKLNKKQ